MSDEITIKVKALSLDEYSDAQLRNLIEKRSKFIATGLDWNGEAWPQEVLDRFQASLVEAKALLEARGTRFAN